MDAERVPSITSTALTDAHRDFPATEHLTYMDVAARCVFPRCVRQAIDAHLDQRMLEGGNKPKFFELIEETRTRFATLIHADPDEIALTKNVSEGLNMVAAGLDWRPGDNVILCPELEHPNNVYPWLNLRRLGVEVRSVPARAGAISVDDMVARVDARTRVITASSVTFAPGFRTDLDALGRACRDRGILFVVDAAQSVGVLATDVRRSCIDALSVSTQKGLLGLYGMGFLYCRREWAERMRPAYLARFGVLVAEGHEAAMGGLDFRLQPSARRFDLGNYNFLAAAGAKPAIQYLQGWGANAVETYVVGLAHSLARGILELGLPVCGGPPGVHLAHIVTVGRLGSGGHDSTEDPRFAALYKHLIENRVRLSIRRGILRFSLHVYNTSRDVERVLDLVKRAP
jgi:cysteine desulfurase / selenocysteine lyase